MIENSHLGRFSFRNEPSKLFSQPVESFNNFSLFTRGHFYQSAINELVVKQVLWLLQKDYPVD